MPRVFQKALLINITWTTSHHFLLWLAVDKAFNIISGTLSKPTSSHTAALSYHTDAVAKLLFTESAYLSNFGSVIGAATLIPWLLTLFLIKNFSEKYKQNNKKRGCLTGSKMQMLIRRNKRMGPFSVLGESKTQPHSIVDFCQQQDHINEFFLLV